MQFIARSVALFLGVGIVFAGPARAQDLSLFGQMSSNAITFEQCQREDDERRINISAIREQAQQCMLGRTSSSWVMMPDCGYTSETCAHLERQACNLADESRKQRQLCSDRALEFQRQEAERKRLESDRQRAEEAAARDQERALRMVARAAGRGDVALAASIARGGVVDPNDPTRAPRLLDSGGRYLANAMGVSTTPAMRLSGEFSRIALDSYRDLGARALGEWNSATGSGAFDVDGSSDTASGPTLRASTVSSSDTTAALQSEAQAYADLWNNGGDIGRVIAVAAITARIAAILQDRPTSNADMARVSLVSGAFARSINTVTEAATRGEISLTDGTSPYAMVSRVIAVSRTHPAVNQPSPNPDTDEDTSEINASAELDRRCIQRQSISTPGYDGIVILANICDFSFVCYSDKVINTYDPRGLTYGWSPGTLFFRELMTISGGYPANSTFSNCRRVD